MPTEGLPSAQSISSKKGSLEISNEARDTTNPHASFSALTMTIEFVYVTNMCTEKASEILA